MERFSNYLKYGKYDLPAGLVVFLVALPLCLGIALASGAPLFAGIITGIVGGLVVSLLSGSQLSVSGPAAGLTVICLDAITDLGSYELFLTAVVMAGIIQLILGYVRAGIIGLYFPSSVIKGMLAAIGLILILKQIPHFLGVDSEAFGALSFSTHEGNTFSYLMYALSHIEMGPFIIGAVALAILVIWEKPFIKRIALFKMMPGALVAVIVSILMNVWYGAQMPNLLVEESHLVTLPVIRDAKAFSEAFNFPALDGFLNPTLYVVAFTIAMIASIETLLSLEAIDKLDPHKRKSPQNRELKAQGVGNILAGLIGGIPLTAVIVRSTANLSAGGRTKMAAFYHGVLLLSAVFLIPSVLNLIPLSALAAILLLIGFKLTKPVLYSSQFKLGHEQFVPFIVTVVAILLTDLLMGIMIGMAVGVFYILRSNYYTPFLSKQDQGHEHERDELTIELSEHVSFLNKANLLKELERIPSGKSVVIDGKRTETIDFDVVELLRDFKTTALEKRIRYKVVNLPEVGDYNMESEKENKIDQPKKEESYVGYHLEK
jgi:MFS superfamily sulfate permease-like transporter